MGTKFKIGTEEIDIQRGINIPKEGEVVIIKNREGTKSYVVKSVDHIVDYTLNVAGGKTLINLEEVEDD